MIKGKMALLEPIVWNDDGYRWPSGNIATSGYTEDFRHSHEALRQALALPVTSL
ncbi:hypothetical protein [Sphingomonas koreensis]|uniref:hypothetical protein n=1 Tax=Sphingomonas koreensis TaxID=93064 RepID=UPI0013DEECAF|nr:hypothetical protein [Sphingomonas koreensis]